MNLAARNSFSAGMRKSKRKKAIQCYALLSFQLIGFFLFSAYPIFWSLRWAFYYYTGVPSETRFVGMENFIRLFTLDKNYFTSWLTTLQFAIYKLPFEYVLAMILALFVNNKFIKAKTFFRSAYYLPTIIAGAVTAVIFCNMFDYFGIINSFLVKFGILKSSVDWLATKKNAMFFLVMASVWQNLGTNVLYFVAALNNISEDLYEVAYLEGATKVQTFFKVTLPLMLPILQVVLLLGINGALHAGQNIILLTNGAPAGKTLTVMALIINSYLPGFTQGTINIGYGAAVSLITSVIMCALALGYMKLTNKIKNMY